MKELGELKDFHSKSCYELYLYAVELAKQVNEYIDKGYFVIKDGYLLGKFIFYDNIWEEAVVKEVEKNHSTIWVGGVYDNNGKVWLRGELTKNQIKEMFQKILISHPESFIQLNYK